MTNEKRHDHGLSPPEFMRTLATAESATAREAWTIAAAP
jgi:hypothetical protein